eukprot:CAMPEP_0117753252 /NCGR_PEP_ID=MMETSP0947-20121206/12110_1 /TAXON_ID=44440 /ORGANISM="Chattonella subsalsa, Strain CCMP2191" /LENGTH=63 /DNA_ID=CAMNT_0005572089 /DNA_START=161 /DNA_END=352 /DNA_ORIENTATION=+
MDFGKSGDQLEQEQDSALNNYLFMRDQLDDLEDESEDFVVVMIALTLWLILFGLILKLQLKKE